MVTYADWDIYVSDLRNKLDRGEIIPDPEWQRGYIWKQKDEILLIDSILRGIPIPKFYLTEEYDEEKQASIHYVVDGQQRIVAIHKFLNNKFSIEIEDKEYFFKDLNAEMQKKIVNYKLNGHLIRDYTPQNVSFLFGRLNRTGIRLTNMEEWNSKFYNTNILTLVKDIQEKIFNIPYKWNYDEKEFKRGKDSYIGTIYTEENMKRMLPADDIVDLCNCLYKNKVEGGGKSVLKDFLEKNETISQRDSQNIKSKFSKTINNIVKIFSKQDLEACAFSKRTHFISLYLAIAFTIPQYYILKDPNYLKNELLSFIEKQPKKYQESVLGGIRQKAMRAKRVNYLKKIILSGNIDKLDSNRSFSIELRQKLWRKSNQICGICKKKIKNFDKASLDHIIPWAKGGKTEESNAQLAHKTCNEKKRDKVEGYIVF